MEGEWEKAARAGSSLSFYWEMKTLMPIPGIKAMPIKNHPVGFKKPNVLGVYDMAGNLGEWTLSEHESRGKVVRGGSWRNEVFFWELSGLFIQ